jgi:hypothetical protein
LNAIQLASVNNHTLTIHALLDFYERQALSLKRFPGDLVRVFKAALERGHLDLASRLIETFHAPLSMTLDGPDFALDIACKTMNIQCVDLVLNAGARPQLNTFVACIRNYSESILLKLIKADMYGVLLKDSTPQVRSCPRLFACLSNPFQDSQVCSLYRAFFEFKPSRFAKGDLGNCVQDS